MDLRLGSALQRNPRPGSGAYLQRTPKQKHLHSSSACRECQGKTFLLLHLISKHRAPAPAPCSSFWPTLLQSRIQKSFALHIYLRGFMITDAREDEASPPCGKRNEADYTWELQDTPNLSVQSSPCSASQHLQNLFGTTQTRAGGRQNSSTHRETWLGQHGPCTLFFTCLDISPVHGCGVRTLASLNKKLHKQAEGGPILKADSSLHWVVASRTVKGGNLPHLS